MHCSNTLAIRGIPKQVTEKLTKSRIDPILENAYSYVTK